MRHSLILLAVIALMFGNFSTADAAKRKGSGQVRFRDENALSDKVTVLVFGASQPEPGTHYQGWLGNADGTAWLDVGRIDLNEKGNSTVDWISPSGENLLATYTQFIVTAEPDGETIYWPAEARIAYRGQIAPEALGAVRALTVAGPDTPLPERVGLATGLKAEARGLTSEGRDARNAARQEKSKTTRKLDEQLLNRIVGVNDGAYGDWDGNGTVENRGDQYGIVRYAQAIQPLVQPLSANEALPDNVRDRANRILGATNNILNYTSQIRNLASVLQPTTPITDVQVIQADIAWLARGVTEGADLNGNYKIEDDLGEGGARDLYRAAQDLGRIYFRTVN